MCIPMADLMLAQETQYSVLFMDSKQWLTALPTYKLMVDGKQDLETLSLVALQ